MIVKIKFAVPIRLLDHLIIPINRESHWFSAHMDIRIRNMSFLDSRYAHSSANYTLKDGFLDPMPITSVSNVLVALFIRR